MRYFPGAPGSTARLRGLLSTSLLVPLLAGAVAVPVLSVTVAPAAFTSDADRLRDKQKDVREQIEDAHDHVEESSGKVARATAALKASQAELASAKADLRAIRQRLYTAQAHDAVMQQRLVEAEGRLLQARIAVVGGKKALAAQQEVVRDLVNSIYQQGDPTLVSISGYLGARTPTDLIRQSDYADVATTKQKGVFDELAAAEMLLEAREDEVGEARDAVADRREEAAAQLAETARLTEQTAAAKRTVQDLVADNRSRRAAAQEARRDDIAVLRRLRKEEARIKRQILAAVAAANASSGPGYSGSSDGFLDWPVNGTVTSPFGYRTHPIYGYYGLHDGTDFGAGCGTPMRAVAAGTVISSYYSSVYGHRLYLNVGRVNGNSVVAVYNHASSYRVRVGERVARGETVGYVGSTGWSTGCHLHFTVLRNGNAVNPMDYL